MSTAPIRMTPGVSVFLYALLDAGSEMTLSEIAEVTGLAPRSAAGTVSFARAILGGIGRLDQVGTNHKPAYRLNVEDRPALLALLGERVQVPSFMGFSGSRAIALRMIVEAGGASVTLPEIAQAIHGRSDVASRAAASVAITIVREALNRRKAEGAIILTGSKRIGSYAWGKAPVRAPADDQDPDAPAGASVITLPDVCGPYRYASGRLLAPRLEWEVA